MMSFVIVGYYECRKTTWSVEIRDGESICKGNPSLSQKVTEYMLSLKRRKIQSGEIAVSEKALTSQDIKKLWSYNTKKSSTGDAYERAYRLQLNVNLLFTLF
jgi:hypothetical protein